MPLIIATIGVLTGLGVGIGLTIALFMASEEQTVYTQENKIST